METRVPLGAVLVGLDESAESARALSWAATEARRRRWPLHLMHVVHDAAWIYSTSTTTNYPMTPVVRDAVVMLSDWHPDLPVTWSQPAGDPAALLADGAHAARVTAVGSRGRGAVSDAVLGSVTTQLIAQTRCPVAVLRAGTPIAHPDAPVVVGVGHDTLSLPLLDAAFEQASSRHVDLVVVHAWQLDGPTIADHLELQGLTAEGAQRHEAGLLTRMVADLAQDHPEVEVSTHAVRDGAARTLGRHAADAALLVVGSRGRGEIGGAILGSVSQSVIRSATCPVLVVRGGRTTVTVPSDQTVAEASS
ncbi:universal stress protein [Flexivirga oryzae]|uniref:Nucleotide-binding universal stress UspA family protein n=1 Tax=Flexivirga oryzae TaxID=1794944 RepID=A0A839N637_9MICO|nr:universal stress protein [Flexivirga oryzae]MBB2892737.1 nucleotide-binding universal stress UspA family protein [Flexivirga oryzae]